ncbi:MAG: hypothetical protein EOL91_08075 [Actinobacteria bacterium]|nr:hypothetical protein [Actinomycetota bacterium]
MEQSFIALVEGKYYTTDGKDKLVYKPYSLKFRLKSAEKPLSDIVRYLLLDSLKLRYPDADGYLTHHLIYIYNEQNPQDIHSIPIAFMGYSQLKAFCDLRRLTYVELSESIALDVLRTEVETAHLTGQQDYEKVTALRRKVTSAANEVLANCELIDDDTPDPMPITPKTKTPVIQKPELIDETTAPAPDPVSKPKKKRVRKPYQSKPQSSDSESQPVPFEL